VDLFAEGIESLKLACSLVLLIPALGITLLGRRRIWLIPAWIVSVSLIAWLRFTGWWSPLPSGPGHILAGVVLAGLAALAWKRDRLETDVAATVMTAFIAGWTWIPCVGRELADILNNARAEPWAELVPTFVYLFGLFVPLVVFAALQVAWPKFGDLIERESVRSAGLAIVFLVGTLVAVTLFDDLASELAERSSF